MKCTLSKCNNEVKTQGAFCESCIDDLIKKIDDDSKILTLYVCPKCNNIINYTNGRRRANEQKLNIINLPCKNCKTFNSQEEDEDYEL